MPDAASIIATIAAIKNSMDIVKAVKDADYDLDKAILKEKIVVLVDSLLEAKIQANETLDLIQEKDGAIAKLENALAFKSKLTRHLSAYYETDDQSTPFGEPYCSNCWETAHVAVHLHHKGRGNDMNFHICPFCQTSYLHGTTPMPINLKIET
jgi:fructose-1,6-bisphosphatase